MPSTRSKTPIGGRGSGHAQPRKKPAAPGTALAVPPDPEIPEGLKCPISFDLMRDPVICSTGHTYEREALLDHFRAQEHAGNLPTCPTSGLTTTRESVQPNWAMRGELDRLLAAHPHWTPADWNDRKLAPAVAGGGVAGQNLVSIWQVVVAEFNDVSIQDWIISGLLLAFGWCTRALWYPWVRPRGWVFWMCNVVSCSTASSFKECMDGPPAPVLPPKPAEIRKFDLRFFGTQDIGLLANPNLEVSKTNIVRVVQENGESFDWYPPRARLDVIRSFKWIHESVSKNGEHEIFFSHCKKNTTFCSRSDSVVSAPFRPPNLSDVPNMLVRDDHWIRKFLDQRHERIHRAVRDVVEAGRLAKNSRTRRHTTSATAMLDVVELRARNFIPSPILPLPISRPYCHPDHHHACKFYPRPYLHYPSPPPHSSPHQRKLASLMWGEVPLMWGAVGRHLVGDVNFIPSRDEEGGKKRGR